MLFKRVHSVSTKDQRPSCLVAAPLRGRFGAAEEHPKVVAGRGAHWPEVGDDMSVQGMLEGVLAPGPRNGSAT